MKCTSWPVDFPCLEPVAGRLTNASLKHANKSGPPAWGPLARQSSASWPRLTSSHWCADCCAHSAVVLACRSRERGEKLQAELQAEATRLGNPDPRIEARHWPFRLLL